MNPLETIRESTPARLWMGRSGTSYRTSTSLQLRSDHAAARDAVLAELDLERDLGAGTVERFGLFEVQTCARSKAEYLLRPDLGRSLSPSALSLIDQRCPKGVDLQIVIGDGLSSLAVRAQVPELLHSLDELAFDQDWQFGQPFFVRYCRVGVLNDLGACLGANVIVLLIGERPGLATAESLSAYLAFQPKSGHTDANRNLISNIHSRGVPIHDAAKRIIALAEQMRKRRSSGVEIKEDLTNYASLSPSS